MNWFHLIFMMQCAEAYENHVPSPGAGGAGQTHVAALTFVFGQRFVLQPGETW